MAELPPKRALARLVGQALPGQVLPSLTVLGNARRQYMRLVEETGGPATRNGIAAFLNWRRGLLDRSARQEPRAWLGRCVSLRSAARRLLDAPPAAEPPCVPRVHIAAAAAEDDHHRRVMHLLRHVAVGKVGEDHIVAAVPR